MSYDKGIGTCLVPGDTGVPCGGHIEEGQSIRNLILPFGGAVVGHKNCVDNYENRKQQDDMVKIAQQQGPGGPADFTHAKDALLYSTPLEKTPTSVNIPPEATKWPEGVKPVADVPMEMKDSWATGEREPIPEIREDPEDIHEPLALRLDQSPDDGGRQDAINAMTDLLKIFGKWQVPIEAPLISDLLIWKFG